MICRWKFGALFAVVIGVVFSLTIAGEPAAERHLRAGAASAAATAQEI